MDKKTVLITGSGSGLGKEAVVAIAKRGHRVIATVQYANQIQPLEQIAKEQKLELEVLQLDILKKEDRELVEKYDIDVLIANAAIGDSGSVAEVSIDRIRRVFETNIFANIELVQIVIKQMVERKKIGRVIFLASLAGRIPMPFLSPYCASKAAIEVFATCLRQEMKICPKAKIEVAIIEPGAYATGFNKENNEKKYKWMKKNSYFLSMLEKIKKYEEKIWNFIEMKPYQSIIKRYIKVVETRKLKARYSAPVIQTFFVQLGRILGM